jgi:hypothetical protein
MHTVVVMKTTPLACPEKRGLYIHINCSSDFAKPVHYNRFTYMSVRPFVLPFSIFTQSESETVYRIRQRSLASSYASCLSQKTRKSAEFISTKSVPHHLRCPELFFSLAGFLLTNSAVALLQKSICHHDL